MVDVLPLLSTSSDPYSSLLLTSECAPTAELISHIAIALGFLNIGQRSNCTKDATARPCQDRPVPMPRMTKRSIRNLAPNAVASAKGVGIREYQ